MTQENTTAFTQQLQKLWSIESQLVEAMPRMVQKATHLGLRKNLAMHFEETRQHKVAIEAICKQLGVDATGGEPDSGLQQVLQEGEQRLMNAAGSDLDVLIIENAKAIEEYEIAAYEPVAQMIEASGFRGVAQRLFLTFEEERQSLTKLKFLQKAVLEQVNQIGEWSLQKDAGVYQ